MAGHELRGVFKHMNKPVKLAQDIVRNVARGARFAVDVNGDFGIAKPNLAYEGPQVSQGVGGFFFGSASKLFIIN